MDELPIDVFCNLDRYPTFRFNADQWSERGWVFEPLSGLYRHYHIDRKEQYDEVYAMHTRERFERHELPTASSELRAWFMAFRSLETDEGVWVHRREPDTLTLYGEMGVDAQGRPEVAMTAVRKDSAPAGVRAWIHAEADSEPGE